MQYKKRRITFGPGSNFSRLKLGNPCWWAAQFAPGGRKCLMCAAPEKIKKSHTRGRLWQSTKSEIIKHPEPTKLTTRPPTHPLSPKHTHIAQGGGEEHKWRKRRGNKIESYIALIRAMSQQYKRGGLTRCVCTVNPVCCVFYFWRPTRHKTRRKNSFGKKEGARWAHVEHGVRCWGMRRVSIFFALKYEK